MRCAEAPDHGVAEHHEAGGRRHEHAPAIEAVGPVAQLVAVARPGHRAVSERDDAIECRDGSGTTHAVGHQPGAALEVNEGPVGVGAEDPVDPSRWCAGRWW